MTKHDFLFHKVCYYKLSIIIIIDVQSNYISHIPNFILQSAANKFLYHFIPQIADQQNISFQFSEFFLIIMSYIYMVFTPGRNNKNITSKSFVR